MSPARRSPSTLQREAHLILAHPVRLRRVSQRWQEDRRRRLRRGVVLAASRRAAADGWQADLLHRARCAAQKGRRKGGSPLVGPGRTQPGLHAELVVARARLARHVDPQVAPPREAPRPQGASTTEARRVALPTGVAFHNSVPCPGEHTRSIGCESIRRAVPPTTDFAVRLGVRQPSRLMSRLMGRGGDARKSRVQDDETAPPSMKRGPYMHHAAAGLIFDKVATSRLCEMLRPALSFGPAVRGAGRVERRYLLFRRYSVLAAARVSPTPTRMSLVSATTRARAACSALVGGGVIPPSSRW